MSKLTTTLLLLTTFVAGAQTNKQIWQFDKLTNNAAIEAMTNAFALVSASNGTPKNVSLGNLRTWVTNGLATSASVDSVSNAIATRITSTSNALASQVSTLSNSVVTTSNALQSQITSISAASGDVLYTNAGSSSFSGGTITLVTNGFGGGGGSGDISSASSNSMVNAWTASDAVVSNKFADGAFLSDFGGVGDGKKLNGISVASGVVTAPSGTFSASDTNKLFLLYLDSTNLTSTLTRISNYSSSTTVTLATNITASSRDAVFGTDNTTAMSNALASLRYSGGTIHIKKGVYLFGSSHRSASGANTTIRMPVVAYSAPTNETVTFRISGEHQPPMTYWVNNNGVPWHGTVLMDVATPTENQTNAFFEDFTQADVFSPIRTKFENLTIRSVPNPKRTALLWKRGGGLHVQDCTFDADISEGYIPNTLGEPIYYPPSAFGSTGTNNLPTNTFAIYGPEVYNSGDYRIRDTSISFWPNCIYAQEHTFIDNVNLTANTLGIYAQAGSSSSVSIGKIFFFCMQYPVYAAPLSLGAQNQRIYFDVKDFGIENHDDWPLPAPPGDGLGNFFGNSPITDVSNRLSGTIANLYGSAYVDLKAFSHPGLEVKNNFKAATYSVPENRIGSNRTLVVEGALASPLGAARKSLLVDVPFSEGSGQYVRSYAPGFHVFGAAPGTSPVTWLRDDQGGRPGVQMLPNTNSTYAMTYGWEETNYFTFNIIYSSTATNATNHLIAPRSIQVRSSTNGLAYHTGGGNWIYYTNNMHDGVVRMVTATYGTNGCALYVNGVEVARRAATYSKTIHLMSQLFFGEFGGANLNAHRYQCWEGVLPSDEIKGLAMAQGVFTQTDFGGGVITNASQVYTTNITASSGSQELSIAGVTTSGNGSSITLRGGTGGSGSGGSINLNAGLKGAFGGYGSINLHSNVVVSGALTVPVITNTGSIEANNVGDINGLRTILGRTTGNLNVNAGSGRSLYLGANAGNQGWLLSTTSLAPDSNNSRDLGSTNVFVKTAYISNGIFAGNITSTNGFVDIPRSSAPTFAQIGSVTNTPVMWWSNSAPCVRYVTYYNASSNAVTTNLFSLP